MLNSGRHFLENDYIKSKIFSKVGGGKFPRLFDTKSKSIYWPKPGFNLKRHWGHAIFPKNSCNEYNYFRSNLNITKNTQKVALTLNE